MAHVRLRDRGTPKGEIECQIGETVNPKKVCPKCGYATGCPNYEAWLEEEDEYAPCIEAEKLIIEKRGKNDPNQVAEKRRRMRAEVRKAVAKHDEEDQFKPDLDAEFKMDDSHKSVHGNGKSKWCPYCMLIRLKRKLKRQYQQLKVWFDSHRLIAWSYE